MSRHALTMQKGIAQTMTAARMMLAVQLARCSEPMVQKTICCSASVFAPYCRSERSAWKRKDSAMPSRIIDCAFAPFHTDAAATISAAISAVSAAMVARLNCGLGMRAQPITIDTAAPNAAAAEIPRVNGSASGLSRMVCICPPARPSAAPTRTAITAAGSRSVRMTVRV